MSKEPSEAMQIVARALMPAPPGTREKKELFEQVGRAIVRLSDIETLLAMVFVIICPGSSDGAIELFHEQPSFERKLRLVDFMAKAQLNASEKAKWLKIHSEVSKHKGIRNLIAHQRMFIGQPNEVGAVQVGLVPPWLKKSSRGRELDVRTIRETADALNKVHGDLWKLIGKLHQK